MRKWNKDNLNERPRVNVKVEGGLTLTWPSTYIMSLFYFARAYGKITRQWKSTLKLTLHVLKNQFRENKSQKEEKKKNTGLQSTSVWFKHPCSQCAPGVAQKLVEYVRIRFHDWCGTAASITAIATIKINVLICKRDMIGYGFCTGQELFSIV